MFTSRRHKSKQDFKNLRRANDVKQLGGQGEAAPSDCTMDVDVGEGAHESVAVQGGAITGIQVKVISIFRLIAQRGQRMIILWTSIKMQERG